MLALSERRDGGELSLQWSQWLAASPPEAADESVSPAGERERRGPDRRIGDRRATDRRQGDRRQGDRRAASGATTQQHAPITNDRLLASLRRVVRERNLQRVPCTALLQAGDYSLVLVDSPDVPADEVRAAMRWQVRDLIDFHVDDALIDVFDLPDRSSHATRRMYAVAARRERVMQVVDLLREADINLVAIDIPEMALRNLAARLDEAGAGVALIAFDGQQGLMTITRQDVLYFSRRIDCGSNRLLADAPEGLPTPALEATLDRLAVEIQRSLDFYESHFNQSPVAAAYLMPVPGLGDAICGHLQSRLGIPTRWMDLGAHCGAQPAVVPLRDGCAVLGAALREERVSL